MTFQKSFMPLLLPLFLSSSYLLSTVSAHGIVTGIIAEGTSYSGWQFKNELATPTPKVAGWSIPEDTDMGYIDPTEYESSDIICHRGATPGQASVTVSPGASVTLQWTTWPTGHKGPVIDYLAHCSDDDCANVDKTGLTFEKIQQVGLVSDVGSIVDGYYMGGTWASNNLADAGSTWVVKIPDNVAPGGYVLRTEIINLYFARYPNGAQNYPMCVNLKVVGESGSGTTPTGIPATEFYGASDAGISINLWTTVTSYSIPGPTLWNAVAASTTAAYSTTSAAYSSVSTAMAVYASSTVSTSSVVPTSSGPAPTSVVSASAYSSLAPTNVSYSTPSISSSANVSAGYSASPSTFSVVVSSAASSAAAVASSQPAISSLLSAGVASSSIMPPYPLSYAVTGSAPASNCSIAATVYTTVKKTVYATVTATATTVSCETVTTTTVVNYTVTVSAQA
ncbi:MAG: hypothetical protein M1834_004350 [Cirrosporium novae-zelandiae]|nr:MAG: hypothetical protein M1834_004350 [Cirrosporium novae-zelandiae]